MFGKKNLYVNLQLVESSLHLADPVSKEGEKNVPGFFPSVSRSLVGNINTVILCLVVGWLVGWFVSHIA